MKTCLTIAKSNTQTFFILGLLLIIFYGCSRQLKENLNVSGTSSGTGLPGPVATLATTADVLTLDATTGRLKKGGADYYGAGVNYYDAFYRVIINASHSDTSYKKGIRQLEARGIPFIRFSVLGYYPDDLNYYKNSEADYFLKLDSFVKFAGDHNVGLIPCFFWNHSTISDFVGEKVKAWAHLEEAGNKTNAFITTYIQKMVTRYGNNKTIWAWEFGNETNIKTDPAGMSFQQQKWLYPITSATGQGGIPATRSWDDTLHTTQLNAAYNKFQGLVRFFENQLGLPNRALFSGNTLSTWGAYSRYYGIWGADTKSALETMMLWQNGNLGTITIHPYLNNEGAASYNTSIGNIITGAKAKADAFNRALFIGEFGVQESYTGNKLQKFAEYLNAIRGSSVQLSALWVFDPLGGATGYMQDWAVTPSYRSYQLDSLEALNNYYRSLPH
ncbi:hypothetical protein A8C56_01060 [Niabella ginsenosidivorans]|uniref:Glycoside hydrolase family 5 domain-containing protein n=2 Tax=Niabella ginsenosidivorans TaxID=1176587 RepID=A0A1A9HWG7_9BACT|nr:hypothetical protein A8C56_01060 [Niabella ginsenosidivorans]